MFRFIRWLALTVVIGFMLVAKWLEEDEMPKETPGLAKQVPSTGKPFDDL